MPKTNPRGSKVLLQLDGLVEESPSGLELLDEVIVACNSEPRDGLRWVGFDQVVCTEEKLRLHTELHQAAHVYRKHAVMEGIPLYDALRQLVRALEPILPIVLVGLRGENVQVILKPMVLTQGRSDGVHSRCFLLVLLEDELIHRLYPFISCGLRAEVIKELPLFVVAYHPLVHQTLQSLKALHIGHQGLLVPSHGPLAVLQRLVHFATCQADG
mmetsp:Transcript_28944/g.54197  ORF Transcript_28944/g.54197 Transcript_28944/m.54197 type:complete len:214 (-) Transcript_28944:216-857(-)